MEKLLEILSEVRPDVDFENENGLIDNGILDSLNIMEIVAEIGDASDIVPENFNSAKALWSMIQRLQN